MHFEAKIAFVVRPLRGRDTLIQLPLLLSFVVIVNGWQPSFTQTNSTLQEPFPLGCGWLGSGKFVSAADLHESRLYELFYVPGMWGPPLLRSHLPG